MDTLHGQVALVTGSSRAIGAAIAAQLAGAGATVAVHGRDAKAADDVAAAAVFLASDGAAWITGVVLDVAGGAVLV